MAFDHCKIDEDQQNQLETARKSGRRRKTKTHDQSTKKQKKKQPQRGMGVAQLERLRLQDGWIKMTDINNVQTNNPIFVSSCFVEPTMIGNVHVPFAKIGGFGVGNGGAHLGGLNLNQCLLGHAVGNVGLNHSSTQNIKCVSDYCGICHKKKVIKGENVACSSINGAFIVGNNQDFGTRPSNHSSYAFGNANQRVEVVAVHKKGSSRGEGVVMEYEFFPSGKNGKSSISSSSSQNDSMIKFGSSETESSSSIDLSLKLYH